MSKSSRKRNRKNKKQQKMTVETEEVLRKLKSGKQLIAVYDSLRKGGNSNYRLDTARYIGSFHTLPIFKFYDNIHNCLIKENGSRSVLMEVYEVDKPTINKVNMLMASQVINTTAEDIKYQKRGMSTPYGYVKYYICINEKLDLEEINQSDFLDYKNILKLK